MAIKSVKQQESVQESLQQVVSLLHRHKVVEELVHKQDQPRQELVERLVHRQNLVELQKKLETLHDADVAYILEALPPEDRLLVWELVKADRDGNILLEVSDAVREMLLANMENHEILAATEQLDADQIADLAPDLPEQVVTQLLSSLKESERAELQTALSFKEDQVGGQMDFDMVTIRDDVKLEVVLRYLRRFDTLPDHTDKLFVVDDEEMLKGVLPLNRLLLNDPEKQVSEVMVQDAIFFHPEEGVRDAAQAFERYDLISAPVVDSNQRVIGRLTVDMMVDVILETSEAEALSLAGLKEDEDLFASVWESAKNRWAWLAINLCTAFIASRVIGVFEGTISKLVALATLMPIVAGIGGNTGNQTSTLIIRGIALRQITVNNAPHLINKELRVALLNGIVWGGALGIIAYLLYGQLNLGFVMTVAMILNLQVAALMGIFVPIGMYKLGRDPAYGSSVLLTAITDSMGFFIFLGLASIFLC
jgi:magnesium transporter